MEPDKLIGTLKRFEKKKISFLVRFLVVYLISLFSRISTFEVYSTLKLSF